MRGRSRADEHRAVLDEIAALAEDERVDAVLVTGDLFDTAAPTAESEQIVYALLSLARSGAHVIVVSGNHDNERRLQAVAPLLELGRVTVVASFRRPDDGGVVEVRSRDGREQADVALLPFLSQRWVVRSDELMVTAADQQSQAYGERLRHLMGHSRMLLRPDRVSVLVAHLLPSAACSAAASASAHDLRLRRLGHRLPPSLQYVALGHLHRSQTIPGPCPIRYAGRCSSSTSARRPT